MTGCSTSVAGRGGTPTSWPGGGSWCTASTSRAPFVELARRDAPPGATFERLDARALAVRRRVRRRHLPVPGRLRPDDRRAARTRRCSPASPARCAPAAGWRSARSTPTSPSSTTRRRRSTPTAGIAHERTEVRDPDGRPLEVDLWTGCYTPRELRLLLRAGTASSSTASRASSRAPTATTRRPPSRPSSWWSPTDPDPRSGRGSRHLLGRIPPRSSGGENPAQNVGPWRSRWRRCYPDQSRRGRSAGTAIREPQSRPKAARSLSDTIATSSATAPSGMGTFDEEGNYTPREVAVDDLGMSFADAIDGTMVEVEDGQLVNGTIVKIDKDEVLLDIGYKSEGVIPARELSIRNDVDPHEIVIARREGRGPGPPEGGQGRPPPALQEACPVRARLGQHREAQGRGRRRRGSGHRGRQGRPHRRHRPARLPPGLARRAAPRARPAAVRRPAHQRQDHRARQEPQQRRAQPPGPPGGDPEGVPRPVPQQPQGRRDPSRHGVVGRQLRRLRRPRRHGRPHPRQRAVVEARRPPGFGRRRRRRGRRPGARRRHEPRAHQPVAEGHPAGSVAGVRLHPRGRPAGLRPGHQARPVRRVRPGRRRHRGPRAHLGDVDPPRRLARPGRHARRGAVGQDHRSRPRPVAASACRSSRPPRVASWPRSTASTSRSTSTATGPPATPTPSARPPGRSTTATRRRAGDGRPRALSPRALPPRAASPTTRTRRHRRDGAVTEDTVTE